MIGKVEAIIKAQPNVMEAGQKMSYRSLYLTSGCVCIGGSRLPSLVVLADRCLRDCELLGVLGSDPSQQDNFSNKLLNHRVQVHGANVIFEHHGQASSG